MVTNGRDLMLGRLKRHHGTVAAYLALLIAVGGTAYAGATITGADVVNGSLTGRDVKNDSLKPRDMTFDPVTSKELRIGVKDSTKPRTVDGTNKNYVTLLKATPTFPNDYMGLLVFANVSYLNNGPADALLWYRVLVDGQLHHDFVYRDGAPAGLPDISAISILCNAIGPGEHTIKLQVAVSQADGATTTFEDRSMNLIQFGPIFHPP
jgi:hypothetical protein